MPDCEILSDANGVVPSCKSLPGDPRQVHSPWLEMHRGACTQDSPITKDSHILDAGAGAGSLAIEVKHQRPAASVLTTDISTRTLEQIELLHLADVTTRQADAMGVAGIADVKFTHVVSFFAIQFTSDCSNTVESMYRVLTRGRVAGISICARTWTWKQAITQQRSS